MKKFCRITYHQKETSIFEIDYIVLFVLSFCFESMVVLGTIFTGKINLASLSSLYGDAPMLRFCLPNSANHLHLIAVEMVGRKLEIGRVIWMDNAFSMQGVTV